MSKGILVNNMAEEIQDTQWIPQLTNSLDTGTIDQVLCEWGEVPFSGGQQTYLSSRI